jgi:aconitate hydratase
MASPAAEIQVVALGEDGKETAFSVKSRLDTPLDLEVYKQGGILQTVLRELAK